MKGFMGRVLLGVAAGVAVYVGASIWANAREGGQALSRFYWPAALAAAAVAGGPVPVSGGHPALGAAVSQSNRRAWRLGEGTSSASASINSDRGETSTPR